MDHEDKGVSPSVVFGQSMSERTSSSRRTRRKPSTQFSPYPLPKPAEIPSSLPTQGLPTPNFEILNSTFTTRKSQSPKFTPETPRKNGRIGTPAAKRSFSTPSSSLLFQLEDEQLETLEEVAVTFSHKDFAACGEIIGTGSQGVVYKAFHKTEKRWYAIKVLKRMNLSPKQKIRLDEEIHNVAVVSPHRHLLSYISAWEDAGEYFLQMELCKESLADLITSWQSDHPGVHIPEENLWEYLSDITEGLHQLHSNGFLHRDLKPANIFVDGVGLLRIGDFGLLVKHTSNDTTEGDCRYLAREVLNDRSTFASDVFGLGATIFEIACLIDMPQSGGLWDLLRNGGVRNIPEFPREYSDEFRNLVANMMAEDPANRPSTENILNLPQVKAASLRRNRKVELNASPMRSMLPVPPPIEPEAPPKPPSPADARRARSQSCQAKFGQRPIRSLFDD
eukprot:CAMPEP_0206199898 /NCGR_PEP_ID=MMETSP0166-20121206/10542_1 /ASSEMBLY_ACC=CAM_ASM_000260 /TAXON_ID=95228 /ORGANISM="Vannella robusta, Strain DIVA3 518/3/11/1/6" /LENGTH=448 /DNA_ID=CAMNT_0053618101 /DNA_START=381 /DNA_END=1727 /DNA_ORIENTATION=+